MDRGAGQATVLGVSESDTTEQLTLSYHSSHKLQKGWGNQLQNLCSQKQSSESHRRNGPMKIPWLEPLGLTDSSSYNQHHPSWTWESTLKATAASGKHKQPLTIASHMRISVFPLTCYQLQNQFLESAGLAIIEGLVPKVEALHLVARTLKKTVVVQLLIMSNTL